MEQLSEFDAKFLILASSLSEWIRGQERPSVSAIRLAMLKWGLDLHEAAEKVRDLVKNCRLIDSDTILLRTADGSFLIDMGGRILGIQELFRICSPERRKEIEAAMATFKE